MTPELRAVLADVRSRLGGDQAVELLADLVEHLVAEDEWREVGDDGRMIEAMARIFAIAPFTAAGVVEKTAALPGLRAALEGALGTLSARKLGKRLADVEGREIAGWRVVRERQDYQGTHWRLRPLPEFGAPNSGVHGRCAKGR